MSLIGTQPPKTPRKRHLELRRQKRVEGEIVVKVAKLNFIALLIWAILVAPAFAQRGGYKPFEELTKIEDPFGLRDPFIPPSGVTDPGLKSKGFGEQDDSNPTAKKPERKDPADIDREVLGNLKDINDLQIIGIITGFEKNRALIDVKGRSMIIEEGTKVGARGGWVVAIREKGIVYAEKRYNIYRQEEVVERVLRIVESGAQRQKTQK